MTTDEPESAASWASSPGVRSRMQMQRSRDTKPEMRVRRLLHSRGLRYRVNALLPIPGVRRRADVVFTRAKVAVFIDGCFWHGCEEHGNPRVKSNTWYWPEKIARNQARDVDTDQRLLDVGWSIIRAWEHDLSEDVADSVERTVRSRLAGR